MGKRVDRAAGGERHWNRTFGEWTRSILIVAVALTAGLGFLGEFVIVLVRVLGDFIGTYLPSFPSPEHGTGLAVAAGVGLTCAAAWGWIGRPRLLTRDSGRIRGTEGVARVWDGDVDAADGGAADSAEVTA